MTGYRYWLWVLLLATASAVDAEPEGRDVNAWIKQMVQAVRTLAYEGTFVSIHGNQLESMRVIHSVEGGQEHERLISLNGSAREVIRDNKSVICILPDTKTISITKRGSERSFPAVLPMDLDALSRLYDFRLLGGTRVAGRPVKVVAIIPHDADRYGYRLFLDEEHALPLKTDMLDASGNVVAQTMFTEIRIDPMIRNAIPSILSKHKGFAVAHHLLAQEMPVDGEAVWTFSRLPAGFRLRTRARQPGSDGVNQVEHFVFSDGLATLSVYIEKAEAESGLHGESKMGAVNAYGAQVAGYQITVVGEVPAQTVQRVVNAMEYAAIAANTPAR